MKIIVINLPAIAFLFPAHTLVNRSSFYSHTGFKYSRKLFYKVYNDLNRSYSDSEKLLVKKETILKCELYPSYNVTQICDANVTYSFWGLYINLKLMDRPFIDRHLKQYRMNATSYNRKLLFTTTSYKWRHFLLSPSGYPYIIGSLQESKFSVYVSDKLLAASYFRGYKGKECRKRSMYFLDCYHICMKNIKERFLNRTPTYVISTKTDLIRTKDTSFHDKCSKSCRRFLSCYKEHYTTYVLTPSKGVTGKMFTLSSPTPPQHVTYKFRRRMTTEDVLIFLSGALAISYGVGVLQVSYLLFKPLIHVTSELIYYIIYKSDFPTRLQMRFSSQLSNVFALFGCVVHMMSIIDEYHKYQVTVELNPSICGQITSSSSTDSKERH